MSGTCPHAGAPLAEGVRDGGRIICPWHKATFCLRTGAVLEPPAVDDLLQYEVHLISQRVPCDFAGAAARTAGPRPGCQAFRDRGCRRGRAVAAQTLRQSGFGGRVVLLDRENRVPYDRTLLSKYHLSGQPGAEKTPLQSQAFYRQYDIERRTAGRRQGRYRQPNDPFC